MRTSATVAAALIACAVVTAGVAHADLSGPAATGRLYPLQPTPNPQSDAAAEVEELHRQVTALHDNWDSLTREQRQQQLAQLQARATRLSNDVGNLPPDQRAQAQVALWQTVIELADLLRKMQPPNQLCRLPFCLPGL